MTSRIQIIFAVSVVLIIAYIVYKSWKMDKLSIEIPFGCPNVSKNILPKCELQRRRPEAGRTYCPRGVCAKGLEPVEDFKTAYMICIPKGSDVETECP